MKSMNVIKAALLGAVLLLAGSVSEARTRKTAATDSTETPAFVWPRLRIGVDLGGAYAIGKVEEGLTLFSADQMKIEHNFLTQESIKELWGKDPRTMSHIDFTIGLRYNIECRGKHK